MDKKVININISKSFWDSLPSELTINIDSIPSEKKEEKKKEEKVASKEEQETSKAMKEIFDAITAIEKTSYTNLSEDPMKAFLNLMQACGAQVSYGTASTKPPFNG